jgi:hypothetical protein
VEVTDNSSQVPVNVGWVALELDLGVALDLMEASRIRRGSTAWVP